MKKVPPDEIWLATTAATSEDKQIVKENLIELIIENLGDFCHYHNNHLGPVEFISGNVDRQLVENEVRSMIEDEQLDEDVHLIKVKISVEAQYL